MKKAKTTTKVKSPKAHAAHSVHSTEHAAEKAKRTKRASPDQRNAFINMALDRYAIPFIRQVEAKLVSWQATL